MAPKLVSFLEIILREKRLSTFLCKSHHGAGLSELDGSSAALRAGDLSWIRINMGLRVWARDGSGPKLPTRFHNPTRTRLMPLMGTHRSCFTIANPKHLSTIVLRFVNGSYQIPSATSTPSSLPKQCGRRELRGIHLRCKQNPDWRRI
ncbi:hypothetical protein PIB30_089189 [Stylosanthes scabra]|uniref:Uncharacterized protein n=1 Tax=Stylosanthes scabra TaxID=79078 RepID=A0ABU6VU75_9FABA|nr:hypothetical protein [Stylosanthes scabra]